MRRKGMRPYLFLGIVFLLAAGAVEAASDPPMPYGDYSQWCSAYGTCKESLGRSEAERAIEGYFAVRRLQAANIQHRGRFVEAEIYNNGRLVDKILFDRKTGRMRSIY
jgi:hypothetical protein